MNLEIGAQGVSIDGAVVRDAASVGDVLGPPSRKARAERPIPGMEDLGAPLEVSVWDSAGVMAGPRFISIVRGENELVEAVWPDRMASGEIRVDGAPLDLSTFKMHDLYDDRFVHRTPAGDVIVIADWQRKPVKIVFLPDG